MTKNYQHVFSLIFAIHEINKNLRLLPNFTLGYHIYDNLYDSIITYDIVLDLLFHQPWKTPNYKSSTKKDVLSVIGGLSIKNSIQMANILSIYKIPEVCVYIYK